tara:strand:+ start:249 stop:488 length:240 start_codon:yes stop_codon:yes gene_type:complete
VSRHFTLSILFCGHEEALADFLIREYYYHQQSDKLLLAAVEQNGKYEWTAIASSLNLPGYSGALTAALFCSLFFKEKTS